MQNIRSFVSNPGVWTLMIMSFVSCVEWHLMGRGRHPSRNPGLHCLCVETQAMPWLFGWAIWFPSPQEPYWAKLKMGRLYTLDDYPYPPFFRCCGCRVSLVFEMIPLSNRVGSS